MHQNPPSLENSSLKIALDEHLEPLVDIEAHKKMDKVEIPDNVSCRPSSLVRNCSADEVMKLIESLSLSIKDKVSVYFDTAPRNGLFDAGLKELSMSIALSHYLRNKNFSAKEYLEMDELEKATAVGKFANKIFKDSLAMDIMDRIGVLCGKIYNEFSLEAK